jgi:DNA-binding transcriptional ArsR family regulator
MPKRKICPECFALIGEGTRMKIVQYLRKKPNNVKEIGKHFSLTQPTISHHLKVLKKIGMIFSKKKGRKIYYFLNKKYPCKRCYLFKIPFKT